MNYKDSNRRSYLKPKCASCILEVSAKYLHLAYANSSHNMNLSSKKALINQKKEIKDIQTLIQSLSNRFSIEISPNEIATPLFLEAAKLGGAVDPWKSLREESNRVALTLIPIVQAELKKVEDPQKRLFKAIEWSIVGNSIDFGTAGHEVGLTKELLLDEYTKVQEKGFSINHFDQLWTDLQKFKECLYICDNAGEIAFDGIVIQELQALDVKVSAVVKGAPISNDAILDDAAMTGLTEICDVITTGSGDLGFSPYNNSREFLDILNASPLVLAKGQANWETTYVYQDQLSPNIHFYNILKIKCEIHAKLFGFPLGANIIHNTTLDTFRNPNV